MVDGTKVRRSKDALSWDLATDLGGPNGLSWVTFGPGA
jgi:hypothetical protein